MHPNNLKITFRIHMFQDICFNMYFGTEKKNSKCFRLNTLKNIFQTRKYLSKYSIHKIFKIRCQDFYYTFNEG